MKSNVLCKMIALIICFSLVLSFTVPSYAASSSKSPDTPKITSCTASGNTVTIKWTKAKGADYYRLYLRTITKEWKYYKTVKKTTANKDKYSDKSKYKLKVSKSGKSYLVYKYTSVKHYKIIRRQEGTKYKFRGKYNKNYTFVVRAFKGKEHSKYSNAISVKTDKKEDTPVNPPVDEDDNWDREKAAEYENILKNEYSDTSLEIRQAAIELYKELASRDIDEGNNNMISPISFMAAMGMLQNGAKGDTLREIEEAFGTDTESFSNWFMNWNALAKAKGNTLKLADSIWCKDTDSLEVSQTFKDKVGEKFDAQFYNVPFNDSTVRDINSWVSDKTDKMIQSVIDSLSDDTVMALINATCFRGKWIEPFDESSIEKDKDFTREDGTVDKADMMHSEESLYFENDTVKGTFKPYKKGFEMMFILPKEGVSIKEALDSLNGDDLYKLRSNAESITTNLSVPRFKFDYTAPDCIESLNNMGITTVFDEENADLTDMARDTYGYNLFVSNIIHKTHIDFNENGTDAAAVTAIIIDKASCMPGMEIKEVCLDRPFIFAIMDDATGTPVFIGTVNSIA